ncbi:MAG: hypothetical protein HYV19_07750 [Gemmatimonadetes bacterium]|nr:hypothetical protein [Gemmatimonadota bacterium]
MRRPVLLALAMTVGACKAPPPADPAAAQPAPVYQRGVLLVAADSSMRFGACGTTVERTVAARADTRLLEAVAAVNGAIRDSLFVEVLADTVAERLTVRETLFAISLTGGSRCDQPRLPFEWVATGTEPFWRVTYDGTQLVLERPDPPREVVFAAAAPEVRGTLTTIVGRRDLDKVKEIKLGILREACRDGMSDAWFPYRAEVRVGELALAGCARRG